MLPKRLRSALIGASAALFFLLLTTSIYFFRERSRGCFLYQSAVNDTRVLVTSMIQYRSIYGKYPPTLGMLGPPATGQSVSPQHAGLIAADLASGNRRGYVYRLSIGNATSESHDGYAIRVEPIGLGLGKHYYYTDETAVVRSEDNQRATNESSPTRDVSCTCDAE